MIVYNGGGRSIGHRTDRPLTGNFSNRTVRERSLARYMDHVAFWNDREINGEPGWGWWIAFGKRTLQSDGKWCWVVNHGDLATAEKYRESLEYACHLACHDEEE